MASGIFSVRFESPAAQNFGVGLIVIKDGFVNGGDDHFTYRGTVSTSGSSMNASISVEQWKSGNPSIVGINNFHVNFSGSIDPATGILRLAGPVTGQPQLGIKVLGKKVADAV